MASERDEIQAQFAATQERWQQAIAAHRMAPPDAGFSARLADLAEAAHAEAAICRRADAARAHEDLAQVAGELAVEIERQDRASGLLPRPRRERRTA